MVSREHSPPRLLPAPPPPSPWAWGNRRAQRSFPGVQTVSLAATAIAAKQTAGPSRGTRRSLLRGFPPPIPPTLLPACPEERERGRAELLGRSHCAEAGAVPQHSRREEGRKRAKRRRGRGTGLRSPGHTRLGLLGVCAFPNCQCIASSQ